MSGFESMTNVDGSISRTADARVPVMDRGFLYAIRFTRCSGPIAEYRFFTMSIGNGSRTRPR